MTAKRTVRAGPFHTHPHYRCPVRLAPRLVVAAVAILVVMVPATASGSSSPSPATNAQVTKLVAESVKVTRVSATIARDLPTATEDFSWSNYPTLDPDGDSKCVTVTACVYGDTSSSKVVVLYGDSHALMWLPAIAPVASAKKLKLVVLWQGVCPAADLSVYIPTFGYPSLCNASRQQFITEINGLRPMTIIIAERTSSIPSSAKTDFTSAQWKAGLEKTIGLLKPSGAKVALIEDTPVFNSYVPVCLSQHSTAVKSCSVAYPNPKHPGLQSAEQAAATATHSLYVATKSWFCTTRCPAVIGTYIPFIDDNHVSFAYAQYLQGVMGTALRSDL
jgi:hypothetical protein